MYVFSQEGLILSEKFQKLIKKLETLRAGGSIRVKSALKSQDRPKLPAEMMGILSARPTSRLSKTRSNIR